MKTEKIKKLFEGIDWDDFIIQKIYPEQIRSDLGVNSTCTLIQMLNPNSDPYRVSHLLCRAPEIIDQLLRQNEIMRNALVELDGCYIPLTAEYVSKKALKKCDEIEVEND